MAVFRFVLPTLVSLFLVACDSGDGPFVTPTDRCPDDPSKMEPGVCGCGVAETDTDSDGIPDCTDNCLQTKNAEQKDQDEDGIGDACDPCPKDPENLDSDQDELPDCNDSCPNDPDNDADGDLRCGDVDNCPGTKNPDQADRDEDGIGDACDPCPDSPDHEDTDSDGTINCLDGCPEDPNKTEPGVCGCGVVDTQDSDEDGTADCLDPCPLDPDDDKDGDTVCGDVDNCPGTKNQDQLDDDKDGRGNACDGCPNDPLNDIDDDLVCGDVDNCPDDPNPGQEDVDHDGIGDVCDDIWFECSNPDQCEDGFECTVDRCEADLCVYEADDSACDDGNPCTDDRCSLEEGCLHEDNAEDCDDGNPCTLVDVCQAGECRGSENECLCDEDSDCIDEDDGNLCNGILRCVGSVCQFDPRTIVTCEQPQNPCLIAVCDPLTGLCPESPALAGTPCNDGDPCTSIDACSGGLCIGSGTVSCDDGNDCTDDSCDPTEGCTHVNNDDPCEDGNYCTEGDSCFGGECVGGPSPDCDDDNDCTADSCSIDTGCVHQPITGPCSDGNACTVGDTCLEEGCQSGTGLVCDDRDVCTNDSCNEVLGCVFVAANEGLNCNDGNACTSSDVCTAGRCIGIGVDCDDDNPCTDDLCDNPAVGCYHVANTSPCDDGNLCTVGDTCADKACVSGAALTCNDGNVCTNDICIPETGLCGTTFNTAPCDDGDACTLEDVCSAGQCRGAPCSESGLFCGLEGCEAEVCGSLDFDGDADFVKIPSALELNLAYGSFTVEAWVYLRSYGSKNVVSILSKLGSTGSEGTGWALGVGGPTSTIGVGSAFFGVYRSGNEGDNAVWTPAGAVPLNRWTHVAVTYNSETETMGVWTNGVLKGNVSMRPPPVTSWDVFVASFRQAPCSTCLYWNGLIDEVRVSSVERYKSGFEPQTYLMPDLGTVALWKFSEGAGTVSADGSGKGFEGTVSGADWSGESPGASCCSTGCPTF